MIACCLNELCNNTGLAERNGKNALLTGKTHILLSTLHTLCWNGFYVDISSAVPSQNTVRPSAWPVYCLWIRNRLKVGTSEGLGRYQIDPFRINLVSFRTCKGLISKGRNWLITVRCSEWTLGKPHAEVESELFVSLFWHFLVPFNSLRSSL